MCVDEKHNLQPITSVSRGSIRAAARALEMAPPSVSQSLKLLEKNVGLTLFDRTTRSIELTDAGQLLLSSTENALASLDSAIDGVRQLTDEPSGKVRITLPKFVYNTWFKEMYAKFCRRYPKINLEVTISDATLDIVKEGIDLGIRFGHKVEQDMIAKPLTADLAEALFASPDYLAKWGTPKTVSDLQQHRLIQYRFVSSNRYAELNLNHNGQQVHVEMPMGLVVNDTDIMLDAAISGLGIGRLVEPAVQSAFDQGKLVPVLQEMWPSFTGLSLYYRRSSKNVRRVKLLAEFLVEEFRQ